ncbi:hypothetical protein K439DRAFT_1633050 [Ramaria rubella]|nr:hypothetical protein K439DRAFT_1633050 [Ramaria rubella]
MFRSKVQTPLQTSPDAVYAMYLSLMGFRVSYYIPYNLVQIDSVRLRVRTAEDLPPPPRVLWSYYTVLNFNLTD